MPSRSQARPCWGLGYGDRHGGGKSCWKNGQALAKGIRKQLKNEEVWKGQADQPSSRLMCLLLP